MIALYAFDHELARAASTSSNPLIGEMRLAFWHEALEETFTGRAVRAHPAAQALALAVRRRRLTREPLQAMIDVRDRELDRAALSAAEAQAIADGAGGAAAGLAAQMLAPDLPAGSVAAEGARWSLARMLLSGRIAEPDRAGVAARLLGRRKAAGIPVEAFPVIAHAALVRPYARGRRPSELEKRLRITWAVARGRV